MSRFQSAVRLAMFVLVWYFVSENSWSREDDCLYLVSYNEDWSSWEI
jgi:hypothetical protein